ncbi:MAG: hypothetical protein QOH13_2032 [Thermoleophilaceae bacterium]|nr:hypothetical protein [Thermoleophilaceae bacterium]
MRREGRSQFGCEDSVLRAVRVPVVDEGGKRMVARKDHVATANISGAQLRLEPVELVAIKRSPPAAVLIHRAEHEDRDPLVSLANLIARLGEA